MMCIMLLPSNIRVTGFYNKRFIPNNTLECACSGCPIADHWAVLWIDEGVGFIHSNFDLV